MYKLHHNNRLLPATCEKQGRNRGSDKLHRIHQCKWQAIRGLDTRYKLGGLKMVDYRESGCYSATRIAGILFVARALDVFGVKLIQ